MLSPIRSALRPASSHLILYQVASLHFERPDLERFPCLALAYRALGEGGSASTTLNAANEVAVEAFLERRIGLRPFPA
jgi:1-deoxy-D-xylulose-5-phosphate reductoisomerase